MCRRSNEIDSGILFLKRSLVCICGAVVLGAVLRVPAVGCQADGWRRRGQRTRLCVVGRAVRKEVSADSHDDAEWRKRKVEAACWRAGGS
jgi:hypothetical protein